MSQHASYRQVTQVPSDPGRVCVILADPVVVRWLEPHGPEERQFAAMPEALALAEAMRQGLGLVETVVLVADAAQWNPQWGILVTDHRGNEPLGDVTLEEGDAARFAAAIEAERDA